MDGWFDVMIGVATVGTALVAGIFFAFSTFVMQALAQRPAREGIAAMQAINVTVLNPWFFGAFFGTAAICLVIAGCVIAGIGAESRWLLLGGCALYLLGCIGVTIAGNVPLNERLARVALDAV